MIRWMANWLLIGMLISGPALAQSAGQFPLAERAGVIQSLDFADNSLVIDGMRYEIAMDAKVEIGGSHGAFTLLRPEMRVYFEYLRVSESVRRVVLIRELPADVALDQV